MPYSRIAKDMRDYALVFHLSATTQAEHATFVRDHNKFHGSHTGAIGGRYTCTFFPREEGVYGGIRCACGAALASANAHPHAEEDRNWWTPYAVTREDDARAASFRATHALRHGLSAGARIFIYKFTSTSLGTIVSIECSECAENEPLTDFSTW